VVNQPYRQDPTLRFRIPAKKKKKSLLCTLYIIICNCIQLIYTLLIATWGIHITHVTFTPFPLPIAIAIANGGGVGGEEEGRGVVL